MKGFCWLILLLFVAILIPSCIEHDGQLEQVKTPVWNRSDIEIEKTSGDKIYIYNNKISGDRPRFYDGVMPFSYKIGYPPYGLPGYAYGSERPLYYDFGNYVTYFVYKGTIVIGAQTFDKEGHLVAEVENIYYYITDEKGQGIDIEEFHYNRDGKLVFKCKSQIDPYKGNKIKEKEKIGNKIRDYYFIWPI